MSEVSIIADAVREYAESNPSRHPLSNFAREFRLAKDAAPHTVRGTGDQIDQLRAERPVDAYFDPHDVLKTPSRLIELSVMRGGTTVHLPYLTIGQDGAPYVTLTSFTGKDTPSNGGVIPADMRERTRDMKMMADFILSNDKNLETHSGILDVLKTLHFFHGHLSRQSTPMDTVSNAIHDAEAVYKILANAIFVPSESFVWSLYRDLYAKPETRTFFQKMGVNIESPGALRDWIETDGFVAPGAEPVAARFRENISKWMTALVAQKKRELLVYILSIKQLQEHNSQPAQSPEKTVGEVRQELPSALPEGVLSAAKKLQPVITDLPPMSRDFPTAADGIRVVAAKIVPVGDDAPAASALDDVGEKSAEDKLLMDWFDDLHKMKISKGLSGKKPSFRDLLTFSDCVFGTSDLFSEQGNLNWAVARSLSICDLFQLNTEAGMSAFQDLLAALFKFRKGVWANNLQDDEGFRHSFSTTFTSLFR